ncbi:MAG: uroporphyrinogen decarboxylase [Xanthomonadales bacterium]|nr:uroporphyrinogen decarboxylase [Gammaproteobacteria bacterium]MBT8049723.1 uroporphyrinogen decarboxylase [Gammaproteobacteria bacterium]MBT8055679.1 uroporphyrinogen decarboxylase [Gammaproteobacteria bacterium]NNL04128.1 uroporphyrinogen decarboxylase [Xanthomonadales bacterium]
MKLKNDRLLKALLREPVDRTPVWIMRQAGRYLPEYLATRAEAGSFMQLCQTPELACEVTLQPLRRYDLDAAIIFSDILTIPDAMGLGLYFVTGEGPKFERPLSSRAEIEALPRPDISDSLRYVTDAVSLTRREIGGKVPLLGFSGSPWTLATYMIEGGSSKTFGKAKRLLYQDPNTAHVLLGKLAETVTDYLNAQIEAGAQGVQIFDTWGGALSFDAYREFSLSYMQQIVDGLKREHDGRKIPVILFSKGCNTQLEALADSGCDALGVDWTIALSEARRRVGDRVALQGNLDPSILLADPDVIRREVRRTLESFGPGEGHVFNLGHGITPDVDPDHLQALIAAVAEFSPALHRGN